MPKIEETKSFSIRKEMRLFVEILECLLSRDIRRLYWEEKQAINQASVERIAEEIEEAYEYLDRLACLKEDLAEEEKEGEPVRL